ncbi:MAG: transglycosylase [Alphaproteobacteria bacterium]|nr:MAG: transglycosylase [Alphaproteobacteria bacterium]
MAGVADNRQTFPLNDKLRRHRPDVVAPIVSCSHLVEPWVSCSVAWRLCFLLVWLVPAGARAQACIAVDAATALKFAGALAACAAADPSPDPVAEAIVEATGEADFAAADRPAVAIPFARPLPQPAAAPGVRRARLAAHPLIGAIAASHRIDPLLLAAIVARESAGRPNAVSSKGARGLLQVMPATARGLGVTDVAALADPRVNLATGATYLKQMQARFGGDVALTLAAYNAGPGAVARYRGIPPYAETRAYVAAILGRYRAARAAEAGR